MSKFLEETLSKMSIKDDATTSELRQQVFQLRAVEHLAYWHNGTSVIDEMGKELRQRLVDLARARVDPELWTAIEKQNLRRSASILDTSRSYGAQSRPSSAILTRRS
jgi:hypothetical protein